MAVEAFLSILGLYEQNNNIFMGMKVPTGINKDDVIKTILLECAELEFLYPEPGYAQLAITMWSNKEKDIWAELQKTK